MSQGDERPTYRLEIRAEAWPFSPPEARLKRALKALKRAYGFTVVALAEVPPKTDDPGPPDAPHEPPEHRSAAATLDDRLL